MDNMPDRIWITMEDHAASWAGSFRRWHASDLEHEGDEYPRYIRANTHPTVKPVSLCQWLCRLVTPPGGTILDPFMGSGSTGKGAILEGFKFIGIEREDEYMPIAEARIRAALRPAVAQQQPAANDNQASLFDEVA